MAGELKTSLVLELVDRITAPARRVAQSMAGLSRRAALSNLKTAGRDASTALLGTVKQVGALAKNMAVLSGAAAAVGWVVHKFVGGVAELGNEVKTTSERLGVGAIWLQEWRYAAGTFGVTTDGLTNSLRELSSRADKFVMTGKGSGAEAFKRLGITVDDLRKTAGDTDKLLDLIVSRTGQIQNDAARTNIAEGLFGSGGREFVALLRQSSDELQRLRADAHGAGAIIDDSTIKQSSTYLQQVNDLQSMIHSLRKSIVGEMLPTITEWLGGVRDLAAENREMITQAVLERIRQLWSGLKVVGSAVTWIADRVGGFGNLLLVVASLLAGKFLLSLLVSTFALGKLALAFLIFSAKALPVAIAGIKAFSVALLTTPLGWIIMGITALAGAAYLIYKNWDGIAKWFGDMWAGVKAFFDQGIGDIIKGLLAFSPAALLLKAVDAVFEMFGARPLSELGKEWIGGLASGVTERFEQLTGWLRDKVSGLTDWLPDWVTGGITSKVSAPAASIPKVPALADLKPKLGPPAMADRPTPLIAPARAEVGGELLIKIDAEGRARTTSLKARGGLEYRVESGLLGVVQ